MDANIVRFFLNPHSEISHVAAFGRTRAAREVYGPATAALTAEFLFSRQLVGQQDRPTFITPGHGEDVLDVINGLRNAIDRGDTSGAEIKPADTLEKLNVLLDRVATGLLKPEAAAIDLRKLVPSIASLLLEGGFPEVTHLRQLFEEIFFARWRFIPARRAKSWNLQRTLSSALAIGGPE